MGFVFGAIAVLSLVYLILRILKIVGGERVVVEARGWNEPLPPLPARSSEEVAAMIADMPSNWLIYDGMTPSLRLQIRGQSYENYRRVTRKYIDEIGQDNFALLSPEQLQSVNNLIMSEAYVVAWEGAHYPNGNPLPFTPQNLAILLDRDAFLVSFITDEAHRLSPLWPA